APAPRLIALALLAVFSAAASADAATVSWIVDADGSWTVPSNWSSNPSLPGPGDDVVISQPGFDTITLLSAQSVNSLNCDETLQINSGGQLSLAADSQIGGTLTLNGGTLAGAGNVTIGGTFNWSGTLAAGGKTTLAAGSITTVGGAVLSRVLENAGIMNF